MKYDVAIIGAGVIGGMAARELSRYRLKICLLEQENDVAMGASKANSGIIHGGYDPEPGTLKAQMNAQGVPLLYEAAAELHVPCKQNGSFVCSFGSPEEDAAVEALLERGRANGIDGLSILTGEQARALEPNLSPEVTKVLNVPDAGIICPYELTIAAIGNAMDNGVELKRNFQVCAIEKRETFVLTSSAGERVEAGYLVNCAGGYADRIAAMAGDGSFTILPRAGEYLLLDKQEGGRVSRTMFQVPTKEGKGVLVTPTVDGNLLTGPTAGLVAGPDSTQTTQAGLAAVARLAARSVPSVDFRNVITSFCGVRSSERHGDFIIQASEQMPGLIHAAAIDSPGLTSCVAIAKRIVELLQSQGLTMTANEDWDGRREDPHKFRHMTQNEQNAFIQSHPAYGKIVCRCETVSEGEMREAIRRNPPAWDLDGVKRRTRGGMGRCQGGFCSPYVMKLIAQERGIAMEEVTKCGPGSEPLLGRL